MTFANHIVVFLVCWWMVLFLVLPWGVKGHHESDEDYPDGIEPGSPVKANMGRKVIITTGITFVLWAIFWAVMEFNLLKIT